MLPEANEAARGPRILLIDDDADGSEMMADVLRLKGYHVDVATSGAAGLSSFRSAVHDVIICDLNLGDRSGYEVAEDIRARSEQTLLIALTGYDAHATSGRALASGFHHHLTKPVSWEHLVELLNRRPAQH